MAPIREFLTEIDARWRPIGGEPITLQIIGSAALMLQTGYARGTKDSDVLESSTGPAGLKEQLLRLAGEGTDIYKRFRIYIDVVNIAILFLPQRPLFHLVPGLSLENFSIQALDVVDVVLSKLKRFNRSDTDDIREMVERGLVDHERLVARFKVAADWFSMDARAPDVFRYLKNLRIVESDMLDVPPADIDLPEDAPG